VGEPRAGDDAEYYRLAGLNEVPEFDLAFDHARILAEFRMSGETV
jgi:hypothetical protein